MTDTLHATCVAWDRKAVLITGASGAGKSALALDLMALGCALVSDDRTQLAVMDGGLRASPPTGIAGLIEARGMGILNADYIQDVPLHFTVDLDRTNAARMPRREYITLLGCDLPLIYRTEGAHFAPAILQLLKSGWSDR